MKNDARVEKLSSILPRVVGNSPNVPRTSGCMASAKYTGSDKDTIPIKGKKFKFIGHFDS